MKLFLCILTYSTLTYATQTNSNFERSKYDPTQEVPTMDGTQIPLEDFNTAPSPVPEFEEEALPGTIVPEEPSTDTELRQRRPKRKEKQQLKRNHDRRDEA